MYKFQKIKIIILLTAFLMLPNFSKAEDKLLQQNDLIYKGAFRVPQGKLGLPVGYVRGNALAFAGQPIGFNSENNSLFMGGRDRIIANISIPEPVISDNLGSLPTATSLQVPIFPLQIPWDNVKSDFSAGGSVVPGGTLVYNNHLISSGYQWFDATAVYSHFVSSLDWSLGGDYEGTYRVGVNPINPSNSNAPLVGGYMAAIPPRWQAEFGGTALTGMAAISMISRTSSGPAASVFNPDDLGVIDPAPATMLVGYPSGYNTIGRYDSTAIPPYIPIPEPLYNSGVAIRGLVFPEGSRSVLFFGRYGYGTNKDGSRGQGENCYGSGTAILSQIANIPEIEQWYVANPGGGDYICGSNPILRGAGNACCYDPVDGNVKGPHMPPYVYRIWAYDANYMVKVKTGAIIQDSELPDLAASSVAGQTYKPWNLKPYAMWDLDFSFSAQDILIVGAAYDPSTQRIFVAQKDGDKPGLEPFPLIHVFEVNAGSSGDAISPSAPQGLSVL